jgi:hypothetical protein
MKRRQDMPTEMDTTALRQLDPKLRKIPRSRKFVRMDQRLAEEVSTSARTKKISENQWMNEAAFEKLERESKKK